MFDEGPNGGDGDDGYVPPDEKKFFSGISRWYKLVGHTPVRIRTFAELAEFTYNIKERTVRRTRKFGGHVRVSTVFLGLDHGFTSLDGAEPVLFETMIFGGRHTGWQWRYHTWDEAVRGHKSAVRRAGG